MQVKMQIICALIRTFQAVHGRPVYASTRLCDVRILYRQKNAMAADQLDRPGPACPGTQVLSRLMASLRQAVLPTAAFQRRENRAGKSGKENSVLSHRVEKELAFYGTLA